MLEYFIATPGARKGLVDTALRTADSGYLTRRLVDVAQELIIRERRLRHHARHLGRGRRSPTRPSRRSYLETKLYGRALLNDVTLTDGTVIAGQHHRRRRRDGRAARRPAASTGCGSARCSPATPSSASAPLCYGRSLATGKPIELGEAVGVIAAQSIGEPGTQLTMRTFHTGGVAGQDIAGGLPRVVELFEARTPRGRGPPRPHVGRRPHRRGRGQGPHASPSWPTTAPRRATGAIARPASSVADGQEVQAGDPIAEGPFDPEGAHGDQGRPRDPAVPRRRGPEGVPRPGRVDPRQAHRADRAPDDPPHRRAGAGRHRLPARRAGRPEGVPRDQPAHGRGAASAPPRVVPS